MSTEPPTSPPRIASDSIATDLGGQAIPEGYVCFKGYLQAANGGVHRIVVDDQFLRWLEVSTEDIAGRLDGSADPVDRRDQIWVRRGARMTKCEVGYAPDIADEGWGVDTESVVDVDVDGPVELLSDAGGDGSRRWRPPPLLRRRRPPPPY